MKINVELNTNPVILSVDNFFDSYSERRNGVYVMYDISNTCLYVGKTKSLRRRLLGHKKSSPFYHSIKYIEFYDSPNEFEKDILETYLINDLKPLYNVAKTYYMQEDYQLMLDEIDEEIDSVKAEIRDLKYMSPESGVSGLDLQEDDYDLDYYSYERKVDYAELADHEKRLRDLQRRKYVISMKMSV